LNTHFKLKLILENLQIKEYIETTVTNPKTGKKVKVATALAYPPEHPLHKAGLLVLNKLKSFKKSKKKTKSVSKPEKPKQTPKVNNTEFSKFERKAEKLYKKEVEETKRLSAEWGQDFTKNDEISLKNQTYSQVYTEVPADKKSEFFKFYISKLKPEERDNALFWFSKVADNKTSDLIHDEIGDVDALLSREDGKGQDYAAVILRSNKSTLKNIKKALMFNWVADSENPASLFLARHFTKKMNAGDVVKKSLKYRLKRGVEFKNTSGGDLTKDSLQNMTTAAEEIYNDTQKYFKDKGIKTLKLYRGSDIKDVNAYSNPIESWTSDKDIAAQYGEFVHTKTFPVEQILMGHFDPDFPDPDTFGAGPSKEIVVINK